MEMMTHRISTHVTEKTNRRTIFLISPAIDIQLVMVPTASLLRKRLAVCHVANRYRSAPLV